MRRSLASLPLPRAATGGSCSRSMSARGCARTLRPARSGCSATSTGVGRQRAVDPGLAVLVRRRAGNRAAPPGPRFLDAVRLGPADDATAVTAAQLREVIERLIAAGHWRPGDPDILIVTDAGYDVTRLAFLLADLPVELVGRLRSDRVLRLPAPPRPPGHERAAAQTRPRVRPRQADHLACPAAHHHHRHHPLRRRRRDRLGPAPPAAHPPRRWLDHHGELPDHRRHPDPPAGRAPARRPRPETGVAVVLDHRRHRGRRGPLWQAFLRRFDLEHTFRLFKQTLGWTRPEARTPAAADRWTWLIIAAHTQLRLARPRRRPAPPLGTPRRPRPAQLRPNRGNSSGVWNRVMAEIPPTAQVSTMIAAGSPAP